MNSDVRPSAPPIRPKESDPMGAMRNVGVAYNKGKAVLSMIEQWVGADKFREGVLDHLRANAWGNATSTDFWAALSRHAPKEVTASLESFVELPGIPIVTVEPLGGNRVRLSQRRFVSSGEAASQLWQIPVAMRYSDGRGSRTSTFLLDRASKVVTLEGARPGWIFPTANGAGYYRWTMPAADMAALAATATSALTPKERVAFVGNASALFRGGVMRGDVYLDALSRFSNDPDPQVINAVIVARSHRHASRKR
jgi:cytosol alanyl aminopeptidase